MRPQGGTGPRTVQDLGQLLLGEGPGTKKTDRTNPAPLSHILLPAMAYLAVQTYPM